MKLRPYQEQAILAVLDYYKRGGEGHPVISIPTGGGKSLIMAKLAQFILKNRPHYNILVLAHRKELLEQNAEEMKALWEDAPVALYSAGLGQKNIDKITVAGIQSIYRNMDALMKISFVICDECHMISFNEDTMYRQLINHLMEYNPELKIIGLTATPYRLQGGMITEGDNRLFTDIAYDVSMRELIKDGYLSPIRFKIKKDFLPNLTAVRKRGGDYVESDLNSIMASDEVLIEETCINIAEVAKLEERKSILIFCSGVKHTKIIMEELKKHNMEGTYITGDLDAVTREERLESFKNREIQYLCNCDVLTTGFNAKNIDMICFLRPTMSTALWVQMAGRGTRLYEGKEDCLMLDYVGNFDFHGHPSEPRLYIEGVKKPKNYRECHECEEACPITAKECDACGFEFPPPEEREMKVAHSDMPNQQEEKSVWYTVSDVYYDRHTKPGKPDSMKVTYQCGAFQVREWVCTDHIGYAKGMATKWLLEHDCKKPYDMTVDKLIDDGEAWKLRKPIKIKTKPNKDNFIEIIDRVFPEEKASEFLDDELPY